jgi:hypothetical protein
MIGRKVIQAAQRRSSGEVQWSCSKTCQRIRYRHAERPTITEPCWRGGFQLTVQARLAAAPAVAQGMSDTGAQHRPKPACQLNLAPYRPPLHWNGTWRSLVAHHWGVGRVGSNPRPDQWF